MNANRRLSGYALPLLAAFTLAACKPEPPGPVRYRDEVFNAVEITKDVPYGRAVGLDGDSADLLLDLYQAKADTAQARAALIYIHGGSFTDGGKAEGNTPDVCKSLARRGYVVASVNYRLGIEEPLTQAHQLEALYRAVQDARTALRFARAQAEAARIDPDRIILGGSSAGAITAVHAACWDSDELDGIDIARWGGLDAGSLPGFSSEAAGVYSIAGALGDLSWMEADDPPLICIHSRQDAVVPYDSGPDPSGFTTLYGGKALYGRAKSLGIPAALKSYRNVAHGDELNDPWTEESLAALAEFFYEEIAR